jgi:bifunctional enzyme CysN/CysC
MSLLETVYIASDRNMEDFRFPVQFVNRPNLDFRGFCGTIASGIIRAGDEVMALPSRKTSRVKQIVSYEGDLPEAFASQAVTITLTDEIDVSRGDMLVRPGNLPRVDHRFEGMLVWMHEEPMVPGKQYLIKQATKSAPGMVNTLKYKVDVNTLSRQDAPVLNLNEIGRCQFTLNQPVCFDSYRRNRATGAFIVIDRITNSTVGAGMILDHGTDDGHKAHWDAEAPGAKLHAEKSNVTLEERQARFGQQPVTILLTGLTGSGKTTISYALERKLFDRGRVAYVLDGQNMRRGISKDLGFTAEERSENLRRSAEVAKLFNEAGLICIAAFVAPDEQVRSRAKELIGSERFITVYLKASIEVCRKRDVDGHYKLADAGEIANFPGVTAPFEEPKQPDLVLETDKISVEECVRQIVSLLEAKKVLA